MARSDHFAQRPGLSLTHARGRLAGDVSQRSITAIALQPSNQRMDQSWRGRPMAPGWHDRRLPGKFSTSRRATLVMRGR